MQNRLYYTENYYRKDALVVAMACFRFIKTFRYTVVILYVVLTGYPKKVDLQILRSVFRRYYC